jgi:hypothetical protein
VPGGIPDQEIVHHPFEDPAVLLTDFSESLVVFHAVKPTNKPAIHYFYHAPGNRKMNNPENKVALQLDLWSSKEGSAWEEYKVAREYVRSLNLKNRAEWEGHVRGGHLRDTRIPGEPEKVYRNRGWVDWNDWLGNKEIVKSDEPRGISLFDSPMEGMRSDREDTEWMNFHDSRRLVREYGFEYEQEWELFIRGKFPDRKPLPDNVPRNPDRVYRFVGWKGWKDWLVDPEKQIQYSRFSRAREFVRSCRIPDRGAWRSFLNENNSLIREYGFVLPLRPHLEYMDSGWKDWNDWLGEETGFLDFRSSRKFVRTLKLKDKKAWRDFCAGRLPHKPGKSEKLYSFPDLAFRDKGWIDWEDWLGNRQSAEAGAPEPETREVYIDCKCGGRIKDCLQCDGRGYYIVHM